MPLYSYHCAKCDDDFEVLMSLSAEGAPACPACGGGDVQKLMSRVQKEGKSKAIRASWRAKAAREGDISNFSKKERTTFK